MRASRQFGQLVGKTVPYEYSVLLTVSAETVMLASWRILRQEANIQNHEVTRRTRPDAKATDGMPAGPGRHQTCYCPLS